MAYLRAVCRRTRILNSVSFNIGNQISGFLKTPSVPGGRAADTPASQSQHVQVTLHLGEEEIGGAVLGTSESHLRCHEADASSLGSTTQPEKAQDPPAAVLRSDLTPHPSGFGVARADGPGAWQSRAESPGRTPSRSLCDLNTQGLRYW